MCFVFNTCQILQWNLFKNDFIKALLGVETLFLFTSGDRMYLALPKKMLIRRALTKLNEYLLMLSISTQASKV